jgi:hypothetical protein
MKDKPPKFDGTCWIGLAPAVIVRETTSLNPAAVIEICI